MCLLFLYLNASAGPNEYKVIIVNNRDEYYHRPTDPARFWPPKSEVIGGTDQEKGKEGGTWLALNRNGRFACLTNILQPPKEVLPDKKGRGFLVNDFVKGVDSPQEYLERLNNVSSEYNGFLLVTMDVSTQNPSASFYTNKADDKPQTVSSGIHAFGNSPPKRPWAKVIEGKKLFEDVIQRGIKTADRDYLVAELMKFVKTTTRYELDDQIRSQGKGLPQFVLERKNAIFYSIPEINYGTRSNTVILVDGENNVEYFESAMEDPIDIKGEVKWVNTHKKFPLERSKCQV